jgi:hypothetical protein
MKILLDENTPHKLRLIINLMPSIQPSPLGSQDGLAERTARC